MGNNRISIQNIDFKYPESGNGDGYIFSDFSMDLPDSKVSVILGRSGCGKTTLLNLISGLLKPERGTVCRSDSSGTEGDISVLFQEPRLLPWRSVRQNIELVLRKHFGSVESREKAEHYLQLVGLADFTEYRPQNLSGGMRQRAAIARAFAYPAGTILMDEPFQALDLGLKINLTDLFTRLWVMDRRTSVFVTHDINEAILLGDEIFVLSAERPALIVEHLSNTEPHEKRTLDSEKSISLERKLYRLLTA